MQLSLFQPTSTMPKDKLPKMLAPFPALRFLESSTNHQLRPLPMDSIKSKARRTSLCLISVVVLLMFLCLQSITEFSKSLLPLVTLNSVVKTLTSDSLITSAMSLRRSMMSTLKQMFVPSKSSSLKLKKQREIFPQSCKSK